jgi:hypothetical protein
MSAMPHIEPDEDVMVQLDRAHKGYEAAVRAYNADIAEANRQLAQKHNPFLWTAQSVLYEAMGKAAFAGFSPADMAQTMGCSDH